MRESPSVARRRGLGDWRGLEFLRPWIYHNDAAMGLRFRRSIKLLPGVRLNLSKSGLGISAGPRGLRVGLDARGRRYASAGIPGTGLSSRHYFRQSPQVAAPAGARPRGVSLGALFAAFLIGIAAAIGAFVFLDSIIK